MKSRWSKPQYEERRLGFEVTMYVYQKSIPSKTLSETVYVREPQQFSFPACRSFISKGMGLFVLGFVSLFFTSASAQSTSSTTSLISSDSGICDDGGINGLSWPLHGLNRFNSANASSISQINKNNVNNLQLKWVFSVPSIPSGTLNPVDNPRAENGVSNGVGVDKNGIVFVPTFDGHMYVLDSLHTSGTDPVTGSPAPVLLKTMDFFLDPKYTAGGFDGFSTRMFPTLINGSLYAGNYKFFGAKQTPPLTGYANRNTGTTNPTDLNYQAKGATLYKINPSTGNVLWKTVIDSNQQTMISSIGPISVPWILGQNLIIVGFGSEISGNIIFPISPDSFNGTCCNYRGGLAALLESTGQLIWKTYTSPKQRFDSLDTIVQRGTVDAWTGASIWGGGNFPVSYKNAMVYAGTGEVYNAPDAADACEQTRLANPDSPIIDSQCLKVLQNGTVSNASFGDSIIERLIPLVWSPKLPLTSSIVAFNFVTGNIQWAQPIEGYDVWNLSCFGTNKIPFCPAYLRLDTQGVLQGNYKDRDTTQPILVENVKVNGKVRDILLAMGKGATVVALDAANGRFLWESTAFGLGGINGDGFVWGKASDGKRFYGNTGTSSGLSLAEYMDPSNPAHVVPHSCDLTGGPNAGFGTGNGDPNGAWAGGMNVAINLSDGSLAWQRCVVGKVINTTTRLLVSPAVTQPGRSQAPVTVANGVLVVPGASSYIPFDTGRENTAVFAEVVLLDADTGALLKSLPLSPSYSSPSAKTVTYQRPELVGDRLYIANGGHASANSTTISSPFNRVLMYQLAP